MPGQRVLSTAALVVLASSPLVAQPAPSERNAALDYWRGIYELQKSKFGETVRATEWSQIGTEMNPARLPAEFNTAAAAVPEEAVQAFLRGANAPRCDFQIQYEQGPFAQLPHLGGLRQGTRALRIDARRLAAANDGVGAAARLAAILRMSDHLRSDRVMISALVTAAMTQTAIQEIDDELDGGRLPPDARRTLADALAPFEGPDPFGMKAALIHGERDTFLGWVKRSFHGPAAGRDLVSTGVADAVGMLAVGPAPAPPAAAPPKPQAPPPPPAAPPAPQPDPEKTKEELARMDEAALHGAADKLWPFYEQVVAAWDAPDAHARLGELAAKAESGGFGILAHVFAPAVVKAHESEARARAEVTRIVRRLRE